MVDLRIWWWQDRNWPTCPLDRAPYQRSLERELRGLADREVDVQEWPRVVGPVLLLTWTLGTADSRQLDPRTPQKRGGQGSARKRTRVEAPWDCDEDCPTPKDEN